MLVNGGGDYSKMKHMFDGYACVTKVKVSGGKAWGSQRYLGTQAYTSYKQQGEPRRQCPVWIGCALRVILRPA
jgi:carlactone synthase/all-trans-10'-apo-beta-carotenal 13,14-cleaving dioxygenase